MDGLYIMKHPIKMDDLGVLPLFLETPIWILLAVLVDLEEEQ